MRVVLDDADSGNGILSRGEVILIDVCRSRPSPFEVLEWDGSSNAETFLGGLRRCGALGLAREQELEREEPNIGNEYEPFVGAVVAVVVAAGSAIGIRVDSTGSGTSGRSGDRTPHCSPASFHHRVSRPSSFWLSSLDISLEAARWLSYHSVNIDNGYSATVSAVFLAFTSFWDRTYQDTILVPEVQGGRAGSRCSPWSEA